MNRLTVALTVACFGLLACDGPGVADPRRPIGSVPGTGAARGQLVGAWQRTLIFVDDLDYVHSSETTFQFNGDGTVIRAQTTRNISLGIVDVVTAVGRWRLDGTQLTLDYFTPSPGRATLDARIVGATLELAGQSFRRLS